MPDVAASGSTWYSGINAFAQDVKSVFLEPLPTTAQCPPLILRKERGKDNIQEPGNKPLLLSVPVGRQMTVQHAFTTAFALAYLLQRPEKIFFNFTELPKYFPAGNYSRSAPPARYLGVNPLRRRCYWPGDKLWLNNARLLQPSSEASA